MLEVIHRVRESGDRPSWLAGIKTEKRPKDLARRVQQLDAKDRRYQYDKCDVDEDEVSIMFSSSVSHARADV